MNTGKTWKSQPFTPLTDEQIEIMERPSDYHCVCSERDPDDHLLNIDEGTPSITHGACGKSIDDGGYIEDWNTTESIPVRVEFYDEGMNVYTGEHNGFWWEITPRSESNTGAQGEHDEH